MAKYWEKVIWQDVSDKAEEFHEAGLLKLNCDKALFDLNWQPAMGFHDTVRMTAEWYCNYYGENSSGMRDFTISQINEYIALAKLKGISWALDYDT